MDVPRVDGEKAEERGIGVMGYFCNMPRRRVTRIRTNARISLVLFALTGPSPGHRRWLGFSVPLPVPFLLILGVLILGTSAFS